PAPWGGELRTHRGSLFPPGLSLPPRGGGSGRGGLLDQAGFGWGAVAVAAGVGDADAGRRTAALQRDALADQRAQDGRAGVRGPAAAGPAAAGSTGPEDGSIQP